ncbi:TetR/AcrR family transcriptional regulator C-terminal ligand-binding domain-containing protein [Yinghuangia sp. ASG 101]|uniref:TetR-like C-terminal domain-containing protein n=1 Tax=Yinghuangia sp. ASG 101 TaxID=2896848 RepID=UPI001E535B48|nr:TetR-like C-terminal domain-containing protein [Yinghuangia sp. ASG 101]UGQ11395.1 TetR/AcrR family transcriptional regulator C-terminal ligand-binding domain-containing protein [Yinghuangia sp. ASG 101]
MNPRGRGRKPDPEVDAAIHKAVMELVSEHGLEVTYDQVAARARVGRASVFRRYPTKRDMLLEAIGQTGTFRVSVPDTGSLAGDLYELVAGIAAVYGTQPMYGLSRQILREACRDTMIRDIMRELNERRFEIVMAVLEQAAARDELAESADRRLICDMLIGYFAGLLSAEYDFPDAEKIRGMVEFLMHGVAASH